MVDWSIGRLVDSRLVVELWNCGLCGIVDCVELWIVWNCGLCGIVDCVELCWIVWNCGLC